MAGGAEAGGGAKTRGGVGVSGGLGVAGAAGGEPVTVLFGRFEDLVQRGLQAFLEDDPALRLVAGGVGREDLAASLAAHRPRVAVLDLAELGTALELRRLAAACPATRLLLLAEHPTAREAAQLVAFGATACLAKDAQARDVLNAIHLASRGLHVLPPARPSTAAPPRGPALLTPREGDVLELLRLGRSNAEIALELHVGIETVRTHARHVYRKLGVGGRRELTGRER